MYTIVTYDRNGKLSNSSIYTDIETARLRLDYLYEVNQRNPLLKRHLSRSRDSITVKHRTGDTIVHSIMQLVPVQEG